MLELLLKQCSSFVCENPRNGAFKKAFCLIFSNLKLKPLIVFAKSSVLDVLPGSECTPKVNIKNLATICFNKLVKKVSILMQFGFGKMKLNLMLLYSQTAPFKKIAPKLHLCQVFSDILRCTHAGLSPNSRNILFY